MQTHSFHQIYKAAHTPVSVLKRLYWSSLSPDLRRTLWESYLPDWDPADGRIQDSGVGVGAHFRHKGEPLPPANTVLLNLLSVRRQKQQQHINLSLVFSILVLPMNYSFRNAFSISAYSSSLELQTLINVNIIHSASCWGNKTDSNTETYDIKWQQLKMCIYT